MFLYVTHPAVAAKSNKPLLLLLLHLLNLITLGQTVARPALRNRRQCSAKRLGQARVF